MKQKTATHHRRWMLRLFEWALLAIIILLLLGFFLRRIEKLQAEAERLNVKAAIENLRTTVLLASIVQNPKRKVYPGGNPVNLLAAETGLTIPGYVGELTNQEAGKVAPGHWYFDRDQGALTYLIGNTANFNSPLTGPARIRLCIRANGNSSSFDMQLEACEPYRWSLKK
jgi:hypothetical protein